jgi:hypothetical protein
MEKRKKLPKVSTLTAFRRLGVQYFSLAEGLAPPPLAGRMDAGRKFREIIK